MSAATIRDLAADIAEHLGLDRAAVESAISNHLDLFGRYEDVTTEERDALARVVWDDVTGSAWPFGEVQS